ncbi:hypothetical protein MINTM021_17550 [Mycobacterium paraintracellulare]|nr:hypothetical protein MINTM021_17550 [Mycobacterium paraintracellulare]
MDFRVSECVKCGAALKGVGRQGGRPSRFCGEGCKVSGESEMRRLSYLLRKFEEGAGVERLNGDGKVAPRRQKVIDDMRARFDHLAGVPKSGGGK